jgi:hypothetical protein
MAEETPIQKIEKTLIKNRNGLTIQQIIDMTNLARGTIKTYLDELICMGRVHEEEYSQNTKVYFLNGQGEFQQKIQMFDEKGFDKGVLFVDVMTDPWKNPFIRVKFRNKNKDIGSIFLNNEKTVDSLIEALKTTKPQLKGYRDLIKKLEEKHQDT